MKNSKKKLTIAVILATIPLSCVIARQTGLPTHDQSSESHSAEAGKVVASKTLFKHHGSSKMGGAAALGMMSMASQNSDSGDSGGSDNSGQSTTPTTPTTPTNPINEQTPSQYAQVANTGVPASIPTTNPTPTTTASTTDDKTNQDKTTTAANDVKDNKQEDSLQKKEEATKTINKDEANIIPDQTAILEKIENIDRQDTHNMMMVNDASMSLLFNNFVHLKDFIVQNFTKAKIQELCNEFIDQIYPHTNIQIIPMKNSTQVTNTNTNQQNQAPNATDQDNNLDVPAMPQENNHFNEHQDFNHDADQNNDNQNDQDQNDNQPSDDSNNADHNDQDQNDSDNHDQ